MGKYFKGKFLLLTAALCVFILAGCARQKVTTFEPFTPVDLTGKVQSGEYSRKVDNFLVVVDASSSMAQTYTGTGFPGFSRATKFSTEKEFLRRMNRTIPELELQSGIRTFGFGPCLSWRSTQLNQPLGPYSQSRFQAGINSLECASGGSPMGKALEAARDDLRPTQGSVAVILLGDGHRLDGDPRPAVDDLKGFLGERLCLYTVWVGNDNDLAGRAVMRGLPLRAGCGRAFDLKDVASARGMADFVEAVFLDVALDSDGDGVPDHLDKCPGTPKGVKVDEVGCPLDSDGDGVPDYLDRCPGTPKGARVDAVGCWVLANVLFDYDKSDIKPDATYLLDEAVEVFNRNPGLRVEVQGHTDNVGSALYNLQLSERRAKAVRAYLVSHGVEGHRVKTKGLGLSIPVASNATDEGRARNRRVEFRVLK